jgi:RHS repeat-associated protein
VLHSNSGCCRGTIANSYTYDSFGKVTGSYGTITNPFRYTGRDLDSETGLHYYRARYYDPNTGRFFSEDPWDADPMYDKTNLYPLAENNPTNFVDPFGLYTKKDPSIPDPSPALDTFLHCLEGCIGKEVVVTATTDGKHQDPGHAAGTTVDIRPPGLPSDTVFCCAGKCGAAWGLKEVPGGQSFKYTKGYNDHFQLFPQKHPSAKAPNVIPPGCKPGGCSGPTSGGGSGSPFWE